MRSKVDLSYLLCFWGSVLFRSCNLISKKKKKSICGSNVTFRYQKFKVMKMPLQVMVK